MFDTWICVGVGLDHCDSGTRFAKQDQHVQRSEGRDGSVVVWVVSGERRHWWRLWPLFSALSFLNSHFSQPNRKNTVITVTTVTLSLLYIIFSILLP